ncbi:hypothetical protein Pmani_013545 [Petrolisthes manimaculis]|uniref:Uncharacterized protein n=1 Tax=Petrolisthes manimaculis TaxID=1843537 RepID=A0AAE1PYB6_9EUCA|nr:hypothetical protein Pmani_013545 [Petrolisthes manimaculis]
MALSSSCLVSERNEMAEPGSSAESHKCVFCSQVFATKVDIQNHFRLHANGEIDIKGRPSLRKKPPDKKMDDPGGGNDKDPVVEQSEETEEKKEEGATCDVCGELFRTVSMAISHKFRKHPESVKKHYCPHCGMMFPIKVNRDKHVMTHPEKPPDQCYPCLCCGVEFYSARARKFHLDSVHKGAVRLVDPIKTPAPSMKIVVNNAGEANSVYYCHLCGCEYQVKYNLQKHLATKHSQEERQSRPQELVQCNLCSALFYTKRAYETHNHHHRAGDLFATNEEMRQQVVQRIDQDFDQRRVPTMLERSLSSYAVSLNRSSTWRNIQASRREAAGTPPHQQPLSLPSLSQEVEEGSISAEYTCEELPNEDSPEAQDPSEDTPKGNTCWTKSEMSCEELPVPVTSLDSEKSRTRVEETSKGNTLPAISVDEDKKYDADNASQNMVLVKEKSSDNLASAELVLRNEVSSNLNAVETLETQIIPICTEKSRKTHLDSSSDKLENRETESLPDIVNSGKEKRTAATTMEAMISVQSESVVWGSEEGEEERAKRKRRMMDDSEEDDSDISSLGTVNPDTVMSNPVVLAKTTSSAGGDTEFQNDECAKITNYVKDKSMRKREGHSKSSKTLGEKSEKCDSGELFIEKVLGVRQGEHGRELLVRWQGFEPADDTWEREEFLPCKDLITKFLKSKRVKARVCSTNVIEWYDTQVEVAQRKKSRKHLRAETSRHKIS